MQTLKEYLEDCNTQTEAWIAADPLHRWATLFVTDLEHWAQYGVTTVAEFESYQMRQQLWDLYKDAHGVRPRWINFETITDEEVDSITQGCYAELERLAMEEEQADKAFWDRMEAMAADYSIDVATALRWTRDAYDDEQTRHDVGYFCYQEGISHKNETRVRELLAT